MDLLNAFVFIGLFSIILLAKNVLIVNKLIIFIAATSFHTKIINDVGILHFFTAFIFLIYSFQKIPFRVFILIIVFAAISGLQWYLYNDVIFSVEYYDWSIKLPFVFMFLIIYIYVVYKTQELNSDVGILLYRVALYVIVSTFVLVVVFKGGIIDSDFELWNNNPNDTAWLISIIWLYLLKNGNNNTIKSVITIITLYLCYAASARWSTLFVLIASVFYINSLMARAGTSDVTRYFIFLVGFATGGVIIATASMFSELKYVLQGNFLQLRSLSELGVEWSLLYEGHHGYAPVRSSVGYRINGILAGIGTLIQSFGVGIGMGRAVALNETISGYPGSLHVAPIEFVLETGIYFIIAFWLLSKRILMKNNDNFSKIFWIAAILLSMSAQTSGYLTHYFTWIFIIAILTGTRSMRGS